MLTDLIIFDGSHAAHRISAATPALTNSKGVRTEVTFGLLRLLSSVLRANRARACYVVWDGKGSRAIRQKVDPDYKANRKDKDDGTKERIASMHEQIASFWDEFGKHLPIYWAISNKYEADDIIAMLARRAKKEGHTSLIVSGDQDLLQVVDEHITVYSPFGDKYCTHDTFAQYTKGYPHGQAWLAAKCLMGDSSDNIKGVGGIGEVTALKLLSEHDFDLARVLISLNPSWASVKVAKKLLTPETKLRLKKNYALMSLQAKCHQDVSPDVTVQVGKLNTKQLQMNSAHNQFVSILAGFTQFIAPFRELED